MDMTRRRRHRLRQHLHHLPAEPARSTKAWRCAPAPTCGRRWPRPRPRSSASRRSRSMSCSARDDIQVVVNLTVPNAHFDVSLAAIRAGKHVFSEKPLTVSVARGPPARGGGSQDGREDRLRARHLPRRRRAARPQARSMTEPSAASSAEPPS